MGAEQPEPSQTITSYNYYMNLMPIITFPGLYMYLALGPKHDF